MKLNLNNYSDKDIVEAFFAMNANKFLSVTNALVAISKRMETRGQTIASENSDEVIENLIERLLEGDK